MADFLSFCIVLSYFSTLTDDSNQYVAVEEVFRFCLLISWAGAAVAKITKEMTKLAKWNFSMLLCCVLMSFETYCSNILNHLPYGD